MPVDATTRIERRPRHRVRSVFRCCVLLHGLTVGLLGTAGCRAQSSEEPVPAAPLARPGPCEVVLAGKHPKSDAQRGRVEADLAAGRDPTVSLERLGWAYVHVAREASAETWNTLADAAASCLLQHKPESLEARLLKGYLAQSRHDFREAERVGRELIGLRETPFDHGLLGDALVELGRLGEAAAQYQAMLDLKPDLHSYSRTAHLRWLHGDLDGALEVMRLAVGAGSPRVAEPYAWALTRLAWLEAQKGRAAAANIALTQALTAVRDYPPALLESAKLRIAEQRTGDAIDLLSIAVRRQPLPEYQWALADALALDGRASEAAKAEAELEKHGASHDRRTFSLYLATRDRQVGQALELARAETRTRGDPLTHDAHAWAAFRAGALAEAGAAMDRALATRVDDARVHLHAAYIQNARNGPAAAEVHLRRATALAALLHPSERRLLDALGPATPKPVRQPPATSTDAAQRK